MIFKIRLLRLWVKFKQGQCDHSGRVTTTWHNNHGSYSRTRCIDCHKAVPPHAEDEQRAIIGQAAREMNRIRRSGL